MYVCMYVCMYVYIYIYIYIYIRKQKGICLFVCFLRRSALIASVSGFRGSPWTVAAACENKGARAARPVNKIS